MNLIAEHTSPWLGCPTPLEMYNHQCALLQYELTQPQALLCNARKNIAGLVQINDALSTEKALAEESLRKALAEVGALNRETSEMDRRINGLMTVAQQRDELFRENQRLLLERKLPLTGTP